MDTEVPRRWARLGSMWLFAVALGMLSLSSIGCRARKPSGGDQPTVSAGGSGAGDPKVAPDARVAAVAAPLPMPQFVGSARCAECHDDEVTHWQRGWHAKALAKATPKSVLGRFASFHFKGTSSEATMKRDPKRGFLMNTRGQGEAQDYPVDWVVGGRHMQDNITALPDGRWQILPIYFHVTSKQWVDYNETKQGPVDPGHPFYWTNLRRMVQHECLDCHATGIEVGFDDAKGWKTSFVDAGVACEACHGPGAKHSETSEIADIFQPKKADRELGLAVCGSCHGPRLPLFPLLDARHRYQPGKRYEDFYDPIVVTIGGLMSGDFFADGRPKTSSFEYQGLVQSACYRKGGATCLSCHVPPHVAKRPSELGDADPDAGCRGCHKEIVAAGEAHTHHRDKAARRCVSCHMPKVLTGVLDTFADHAIDVPSLTNTEKHKVPNACSRCHADKPLATLATVATVWWPKLAEREARRVRLADAFDDATAAQSSRPLTLVVNDKAEAPTLRGAALMVLAIRFGASAAPAILPGLEASEPLMRAKAAEALGGARVRSAADALARHLDDPVLQVRVAAANALAALEDPRTEAAMQVLADDPATADLLQPRLWLGRQLARAGKFDEARRHLSAAVQGSPYHPEALWYLAEVEARQGNAAAARRLIDRILALDPVNRGATALRAQLDRAAAPSLPPAPPAPPASGGAPRP
jgi:Flp pilus assembly protein TadD